ncbi:MAG: hypothetical protein ACLSVG_03835 [Clostridia bacterium]
MYHENTKIREIMHLPGILQLVEKYTGKRMSMSTLKMGANLTIRTVGSHLHWTAAQMQDVLGELNKIAEQHPSAGRQR